MKWRKCTCSVGQNNSCGAWSYEDEDEKLVLFAEPIIGRVNDWKVYQVNFANLIIMRDKTDEEAQAMGNMF